MTRFFSSPRSRSIQIKLAAVVCVAGVHLAVLAAILAAPVKPNISMPESVEIQFVDIGPELVEAAVNPEPAPQEIPPEPVAEPEPPKPEPVIEPEPEPVIEPEPEPEPVVEKPEPEAITPEPPKLKPKPKPKPKPVVKAAPRPPEAPAAAPSGAATTQAAPQAPVASRDPNTPRLIGRVDYLGQRPRPDYPRVSQRRGETGRVMVRVLISPQGTVANASVRSSSGHARLDESALAAARSARFKPYTENGVAYPALADIPFDFVL